MKALKYKGSWNISLEEVANLQVKSPQDVVVDVKYCGICGTDTGIVSGDYPVAVKGVTIGHEASGIVAEVGSEVSNVKVGDRVVINPTSYCGTCRMCQTLRINHCYNKQGTESGVSYDGTFAHQFRTQSNFVFPIPDHISLKAAALTEPLSCIISGLRKIHPATMTAYSFIFGAGPMGLLYAWALSLKGIMPVMIENSKPRLNFARHCLPRGVKIYPSLETAAVEHFNDPKIPLDLVIDTTSGLLEKLYPRLACGSTYMAIGLKQKDCTINTIDLADKSLSILGSIDSLHGSFLEAFHLITKEIIPVEKLVSHVIPLADYQKGFSIVGCDIESKTLVQSDEESCKVLLKINEE